MTYLLQLLAIPLCVGPGGVTGPVGVGEVKVEVEVEVEVEVMVAVAAGALTQ
jgi:hypothetical protein